MRGDNLGEELIVARRLRPLIPFLSSPIVAEVLLLIVVVFIEPVIVIILLFIISSSILLPLSKVKTGKTMTRQIPEEEAVQGIR